MKTNIIIGLLTMTLFSSCYKSIFGGKDDILSLPKQPYTGNELRTDGYYYMTFKDGIFVRFLYRNGIMLDSGGLKKTDIPYYEERIINGEFYDHVKNVKFGWGVFVIQGNNIKYERWYPSAPPYKVYVREGAIINDTTFIITKLYRMVNGEITEESDLNEIYHFKAFSPKPDSTNNFTL